MVTTTDGTRGEFARITRFVLVGGSNTLITGVAFALLAKVMDARVAYTLVFAAGLAYTTWLTGRYVFRAEQVTRRRTIAFVSWYLGVYLLGLGVIAVARRYGLRSEELLAVAVIAVTAPCNYLGGRLAFHRAATVGDTATPDDAHHRPRRDAP